MPEPEPTRQARNQATINRLWTLATTPTSHDAHGNGMVRCSEVVEALTQPETKEKR